MSAKIKRFLLFAAVPAVFLLFVIIYNAYSNNNHLKPGINGLRAAYIGETSKPIYSARPKPAGAPVMVKDEEEAEALFSKL